VQYLACNLKLKEYNKSINKEGDANMERATNKTIYSVLTKDNDRILVKTKQENLEKLFQENKIKEYRLAKIFQM
jgi:hypothetical protein